MYLPRLVERIEIVAVHLPMGVMGSKSQLLQRKESADGMEAQDESAQTWLSRILLLVF